MNVCWSIEYGDRQFDVEFLAHQAYEMKLWPYHAPCTPSMLVPRTSLRLGPGQLRKDEDVQLVQNVSVVAQTGQTPISLLLVQARGPIEVCDKSAISNHGFRNPSKMISTSFSQTDSQVIPIAFPSPFSANAWNWLGSLSKPKMASAKAV